MNDDFLFELHLEGAKSWCTVCIGTNEAEKPEGSPRRAFLGLKHEKLRNSQDHNIYWYLGWARHIPQQVDAWTPVVPISRSVVSNSLPPQGLQPPRCLCPWRVSRQEYWSGLPCPPPRDLPNPGTKPRSPTLQADSLPSKPPAKPAVGMTILVL